MRKFEMKLSRVAIQCYPSPQHVHFRPIQIYYTKNLFYLVPETSSGTYVISVVCQSVSLSGVWCLVSVRNADISETIIARAAKFGMHNLHIKSAKFVEGIFKRCLRS